MKKIYALILIVSIAVSGVFSNPYAIDYSKLPQDEECMQLVDDFLSSYNYICQYSFDHLEDYKNYFLTAETLYNYLCKIKKPNYDEELLKLLTLRCIYNSDQVQFKDVEKLFKKINKKYSKNAEHHWIYGNFLVTCGRAESGQEELNTYLKMKDYYVSQYWMSDYAYSLTISFQYLKAYYALTNGGQIDEADVDPWILRIIKENIEESSLDKEYTNEQVWRLSGEKDGYYYLYSTALGVSFPVKGSWEISLQPISKEKPAFANITVDDFKIKNNPVNITVLLLFVPQSVDYNFSEEVIAFNSSSTRVEEDLVLANQNFKKITYENPDIYNDDRKGFRSFLYVADIVPEKFSGAKCEHPFYPAAKKSQSSNDSVVYYSFPHTLTRLNEPVRVYVLVDSCAALSKETDKLMEDLFAHAVFK